MKTKITILFIILLIFGCGSKKSVSKSARKEKTEINLIDSSKIRKKIDIKKQFIDTNVKERIVTLYGVRFDTIAVNGKPRIISLSYPIRKEENRDVFSQNYIYKLHLQDSIQKAIDLKYKTKIDEKEQKILELKESTQVYQIALLAVSIIAFILMIFYIVGRIKLRKFGF